jgi:hypothetical protein
VHKRDLFANPKFQNGSYLLGSFFANTYLFIKPRLSAYATPKQKMSKRDNTPSRTPVWPSAFINDAWHVLTDAWHVSPLKVNSNTLPKIVFGSFSRPLNVTLSYTEKTPVNEISQLSFLHLADTEVAGTNHYLPQSRNGVAVLYG